MRIMVLFDLPVLTENSAGIIESIRKYLLKKQVSL